MSSLHFKSSFVNVYVKVYAELMTYYLQWLCSGFPNGTIGNFTNVFFQGSTNGTIGSQWYHWLTNGTGLPMVPMVPLVEPVVPLALPLVPMVLPMVPFVEP